MRTRLYNEYGAGLGPHVNHIDDIIRTACSEVLKYCDENNIDFRDAENVCNSHMSCNFAEHVLRTAVAMKKKEREAVERIKKHFECCKDSD